MTISSSILNGFKLRSRAYLTYVKEHKCIICFAEDCDPHHLTHVEGKGMGITSGDQFAVPLCRHCHNGCHSKGNEEKFWALVGIDPIEWAEKTYTKWKTPRGELHC